MGNYHESLLAEYEQANDLIRHRESLMWQVGAIFIPFSLGTFPLAIKYLPEELPFAAAVSVLAYIPFWFFYERMSDYQETSYKRLAEIEDLLCLDLHRRIGREDAKNRRRKIVKVKYAIRFLFCSLCALWVWKIFNSVLSEVALFVLLGILYFFYWLVAYDP